MNSVIEKLDLLTCAMARECLNNKYTIEQQIIRYNLNSIEKEKLYNLLENLRLKYV